MTYPIIYLDLFQNKVNRQINYKNLKKKDILVMLYRKQRVLTELKTSLAVEKCQDLIVGEIEKLFKVKYNEVSKLINKL